MGKKGNKPLALKGYLFAAIFILSIFSCQSSSYMDLLTGGDVKYWGYGNPPMQYYLCFNKNTRRTLDYDENLKGAYRGGMDALGKGKFFKIEGNNIMRSWVTRYGTKPADTIKIVYLSKKRFVMFHRQSIGPMTLRHIKMSQIKKIKKKMK